MSDEDNETILIACGECSNRITTSFGRLRDTAKLECPACGHEMARERSQVLDHIQSIRKAVAEAGGRADPAAAASLTKGGHSHGRP